MFTYIIQIMKGRICLLLICCIWQGMIRNEVVAQTAETVYMPLWPQGYPNTNGMDMHPEDETRGNYKPAIRAFLPAPEKATGRAVIACPGGAYGGLAYHHEGYDWASYFNEQGIVLIVLKYRMPCGNREVPYSDVEEAMRVIKEQAAWWNINPVDICIMGSSAGGHLAATYAVKSEPELRPAFQILFYPVITMDKSYTHMGSHDNLLGADASAELEEFYSNEKQIHAGTPRAFITFSHDDTVVPSENGVNYYLALKKNNIPASLYIYPSGGHGWGARKDFRYHNELIADLTAWLESF